MHTLIYTPIIGLCIPKISKTETYLGTHGHSTVYIHLLCQAVLSYSIKILMSFNVILIAFIFLEYILFFSLSNSPSGYSYSISP